MQIKCCIVNSFYSRFNILNHLHTAHIWFGLVSTIYKLWKYKNIFQNQLRSNSLNDEKKNHWKSKRHKTNENQITFHFKSQ